MRLLMCPLLVLSLFGCQETTAPDVEYGTARIAWWASSRSVIEIHDTVRVGVPFEVGVNTFGDNSCWGVERTTVHTGEFGAVIAPYNKSFEVNGGGCWPIISNVQHRTILTFTTPGEKTVSVRARDYENGHPIQVDVTLTVRP